MIVFLYQISEDAEVEVEGTQEIDVGHAKSKVHARSRMCIYI